MSISTDPNLAPGRFQLYNGDRMTRVEFHEIYREMPDDFQAELVAGVVYVASPLKRRHGTNTLPLGSLLFAYEANTPGVESGDNATILLGDLGEPQPDLFLRVLPECGGQSNTTEDDYVEGAPELIAEIAHSSRAIDLHDKRDDYAKYGVREYLVLNLQDQRMHWFDLSADKELGVGEDSVVRVATFPGLWIHVEALLAKDHGRMMQTLEQGLDTPEHRDFVAQLARARRDSSD